MNLQDLPEAKPTLEQLKSELVQFCERFTIKKFEADDIVELLEDGEEVSWIVEQLQQDDADLDREKAVKILSGIHEYVAPEEEPEEPAEEVEVISEPGVPATDQSILQEKIDFGNIDLKEIAPALEQMTGQKLDSDTLKQLEAMMEGDRGKIYGDFALWCQEQGIDLSAMSDPKKIDELQEQWMQAPRPMFDGKTPAEMSASGEFPGLTKVETYHRETPKVGRNDPCPCGSGKKYKKCCGRNL